MAAKPCEVCGTMFSYRPSQEQKRRTCSRSCGSVLAFQSRQAQGEVVMPVKPRRGDTIACGTCGKTFYRSPAEVARGRQACSKPCSDIAMTKTPVIKQCEVCGKELRLKPSQAAIRYCSKVCDGIGRTKRPLERMHNGKPARQNDKGYVMVYEPDHPNKSFSGWQYEHRLVAEQVVGRYLESSEHVHHINGIKEDNRSENLAVMDGVEHAKLSSQDYRDFIDRELAELAEYRKRYGPLKEE